MFFSNTIFIFRYILHFTKRLLRPCLVHLEIKKNQDSPSHQILWHMYETLNIDENKN